MSKLLLSMCAVIFSACTILLNMTDGYILPKTADEDHSLPHWILNDYSFHLQTFGNPENQTIIFMHGGAADFKASLSFMQELNSRKLTDNYHLVYYDQRGKGLSQRTDNAKEITLNIYRDDLNSIVDFFSPGKQVIIVAHSFGGIITANFINSYPEKIEGVVFLEPGPFSRAAMTASLPKNLTLEWVNDLMWGQQIIGADTHAQADLQFAAIMMSPEFNVDGDSNQMSPFWRIGAFAQSALEADSLNKNFDFTTRLHEITASILFVVGDKYSRLGRQFQEANISQFSNTTLVTIENAGHEDLIWESTHKVLPHIFTYLDNL